MKNIRYVLAIMFLLALATSFVSCKAKCDCPTFSKAKAPINQVRPA